MPFRMQLTRRAAAATFWDSTNNFLYVRPVDLGYTRHTIGPPGGYQATDPKDVGRVFARDGMRIMSPPQAGLTAVGDVPRLEILATCPGGGGAARASNSNSVGRPVGLKVTLKGA